MYVKFLYTVIRTLSVKVDKNRTLSVDLLTYTPQYGFQRLASVSISDPAQANTSSNSLLAYRPNYNLNGIFPCVPPETRVPCGVVSMEEDTFSGGQVILQAIDRGNNFQIFSSTEPYLYTYVMAVQGCPQLTNSCWPNWVERRVTCQLPWQYCG